MGWLPDEQPDRVQGLLQQQDEVRPAAEIAELGDGHREPEQLVDRAVLAQPRVGAAQVREVGVEPSDRGRLARPTTVRGDLVREPGRPGRVPHAQVPRDRIRGEPGAAERAQGLEHPEPSGLTRVPDHQ